VADASVVFASSGVARVALGAMVMPGGITPGVAFRPGVAPRPASGVAPGSPSFSPDIPGGVGRPRLWLRANCRAGQSRVICKRKLQEIFQLL